ncbi:hypothetical protein GCM10025865_33560 (plasmid) [Paraoerskovia sediminicola]|uniref:Integral membrane protein n=1 Tax=Paraoerskovia sediminicola TaxID=1138587 RepID=A0ABM8G7B7_9CELL|nr:hypothetical protein GCM10025865_33120 [Paraoerskovia sediminicola]BDZ44057.1 hypothetical protein GCM10025865_33560 [Paraoerskovia sediminicola]
MANVAGAINTVSNPFDNLANSVIEAFGKTVTALGTVWVKIGTPNLTGSGGESTVAPGSRAPDSGNITTILGYVSWIGFSMAAIALVILGALIAVSLRRGEGVSAVGRIGFVLGGAILIGGSAGIVSVLLPASPGARPARSASFNPPCGGTWPPALWFRSSSVASAWRGSSARTQAGTRSRAC